jgi:hypothetical protein
VADALALELVARVSRGGGEAGQLSRNRGRFRRQADSAEFLMELLDASLVTE